MVTLRLRRLVLYCDASGPPEGFPARRSHGHGATVPGPGDCDGRLRVDNAAAGSLGMLGNTRRQTAGGPGTISKIHGAYFAYICKTMRFEVSWLIFSVLAFNYK